MSEMNYYQNPPEYHNFTNAFSNYDIHNNRVYENVESVPIDKKESRLTIQDMIKIQRALQILRNYLQQFYPQLPNVIIMHQMRWLYYRCYTQKSIQPLRIFIKGTILGIFGRYTDISILLPSYYCNHFNQ